MAEIVHNCPRCGAQNMTFDVLGYSKINENDAWYELFCRCRKCERSSILICKIADYDGYQAVERFRGNLLQIPRALNGIFEIHRHVSIKDSAATSPPEYVPSDIEAAFKEGATCLAVGCYNATATMFRLCVDLATTPFLPGQDVDGLNSRTRRDLGLRLRWLFDTKRLPEVLRDLASCIREDGNDGAHAGTMTEADAADLADFTYVLLDRLYTEPEKIRIAQSRRADRRTTEKDKD